MQPYISYLICATPRSGSSLLCETLKTTEIAGLPEEYLSPGDEAILQACWRTSGYAEYLANVFKHGTTPNGVFGAKMMWGYFAHFVREVRGLPDYKGKVLTVHDLLQIVFPNLHYIWIKRNDKVRQAVSHVKAKQTDVWGVVTETAAMPAKNPVFSYRRIDYTVQELEAHEAAWQDYFTVNNIQPFVVVYEDFVLKKEEIAIQILKYLGVPEAEGAKFGPRCLQKQANEESEQWVLRYHHLKMKSKPHRLISHAHGLLFKFLQSRV